MLSHWSMIYDEKEDVYFDQYKTWHPYVSKNDPCRPMKEKVYATPPELYLGFQPPNLPRFEIHEALYKGTLWKPLFSPYEGRFPH